MKKLFLIGLLMMSTGCAKISEIMNNDTSQEPDTHDTTDTKEKTLTCTNEAGESVIFHAKGDEIHSMKQTTFISYEELGINPAEVNKDAIQEKINQGITDKYQGLAGVGVIGQMAEDKVEVIVEIDYDQADPQALIDAGLLDKGEKDSQYISLEKTQSVYSQNYACSFE